MINIGKDIFFYNFLYSAESLTSPQSVIDACYELRDINLGNQVSNKNGWQSSPLHYPTNLNYIFNNISEEIINLSNFVSQEEGLNISFEIKSFWANINSPGAYNIPHSHGHTDLIGLYYAKVPENSGNLCIVRNDSSLLSSLYRNKKDELHVTMKTLSNRMYIFPAWMLHYVEVNESNEDRVSLSFNLVVKNI